MALLGSGHIQLGLRGGHALTEALIATRIRISPLLSPILILVFIYTRFVHRPPLLATVSIGPLNQLLSPRILCDTSEAATIVTHPSFTLIRNHCGFVQQSSSPFRAILGDERTIRN
jgi:hypothetical protein